MTLLETAIESAKKGGTIVGKYFNTSVSREVKADKSFVTAADKEAESAIIAHIKKHFPDHGILSEESGAEKRDSPYEWVIDPLDGTANFVNGIPLFSVSIAVLKNGVPEAAVVYQPVGDSLYAAERGRGTTMWAPSSGQNPALFTASSGQSPALFTVSSGQSPALFTVSGEDSARGNGKKVKVSDGGAEHAMITFGPGKKEKEKLNRLLSVAEKFVKSKRYLGSCALELAYVARGGIEGFLCLGLNKWDYAAGVLLVEEAGGKITNFTGAPWTFGSSDFFIASNGKVHSDLLKLVALVS